MDDVMVFTEMLMQYNFHLDLLRSEAAGAQGMFFVDELDGDDGFRGIVGYGFADPKAALAGRLDSMKAETDEAYAPCPIVLLTRRKGRFVGRGAAWLPGGAGPIVVSVLCIRVGHWSDQG